METEPAQSRKELGTVSICRFLILPKLEMLSQLFPPRVSCDLIFGLCHLLPRRLSQALDPKHSAIVPLSQVSRYRTASRALEMMRSTIAPP